MSTMAAAGIAFAATIAGVAAERDVAMTAADGAKLKATYFAAAGPGPAVLLLHMCGDEASRKDWTALASGLAAAGVHALALDLRGFGESGFSPGAGKPADNQQKQWPGDVETALAYLAAQQGVDARRIGAAGASCGAREAVVLARGHDEVRALALLSGTTDEAGRLFLAGPRAVAVLAAGSREDGGFDEYMSWLVGFSSHPESAALRYERAGHGTDMLAAERELAPRIVEHFVRHLGRSAGATADSRPTAMTPARELWEQLAAPGGALRAMLMLEAARRRDPDAVVLPEIAVLGLAREREVGGRPREAIEILEVALSVHPRSPWVHAYLARACESAGEAVAAIRWARAGLELLGADASADDERAKSARTRMGELLARLEGTAR